MKAFDLTVINGDLVLPDGGVRAGNIGIRAGRIAAITSPEETLEAEEIIDAEGLHVLPGVVDPHAHIGLGGGLDEYAPDTAAAARGGVTTVLYILIDSGPYLKAITTHHEAASAVALIDYGFHLTLMHRLHTAELTEIADRWAIRSYKYYMSFRGDEGAYLGVAGTDDGVLFRILEAVAGIGGILAVHAENIEVVWHLREKVKESGREDLAAWDASRSSFVEGEALYRAAVFGAATKCPLYFVHVSSQHALTSLHAARTRFPAAPLLAETCPHYLTHSIESDVGVLGKVNPPLRSPADVDSLWRAVRHRTIDTIGSDHVARRRSAKRGDIWEASAGFPGMPTLLPVLLTYGYHGHGIPLERIAELTSLRPASVFGLGQRKGKIAPGFDADLVAVDLDAAREVRAEDLGTWSDYSLYEGKKLKGWPVHTIVRGSPVLKSGELVGRAGYGQRLATSFGGAGPKQR